MRVGHLAPAVRSSSRVRDEAQILAPAQLYVRDSSPYPNRPPPRSRSSWATTRKTSIRHMTDHSGLLRWRGSKQTDGTASAAVHKTTPPVTKQYGPTNADLIDVFAPASGRAAPVLVFLHGGAWTRNTRDDVSYPAPTFVGRGGLSRARFWQPQNGAPATDGQSFAPP